MAAKPAAAGSTPRRSFTELYLATRANGWQYSAGLRVVQWDVGFGFRPNDLVQQESTRPLLEQRPVGQGVLLAEKFVADASLSMVWVNAAARQRGRTDRPTRKEQALAMMGFVRHGATDLYGFARIGRSSRVSLGTAFVRVLGDSVADHGSARWLQRHQGWLTGVPAGDPPLAFNPWLRGQRGATGQAVLGLT